MGGILGCLALKIELHCIKWFIQINQNENREIFLQTQGIPNCQKHYFFLPSPSPFLSATVQI